MSPNLDTYAAAVKVERELAMTRADRLTPLLDAAKAPRSAPAGGTSRPTFERRGRLAAAVRSLRWVLRPAHA